MTTLLKWSCYNGDSVKVKHVWSKNLVTLSRHTVYMASDQLYFFIFFVLMPTKLFLTYKRLCIRRYLRNPREQINKEKIHDFFIRLWTLGSAAFVHIIHSCYYRYLTSNQPFTTSVNKNPPSPSMIL